MMGQFSQTSKDRLATCHVDLQRLFEEVVKHIDCTVVCGHRSKEDQEAAVHDGKSKVHFPNSKHNSTPSQAADVIPYPVDWNNRDAFYHFVGFVRGIASQMGIKIRVGADWNGNMDLHDQRFIDLPHFELAAEHDDAGTASE